MGQPPEYWTGGYRVFSEALPIYPLLTFHPLAFVVVCLVIWLPFTYWLTKKLREPLNVFASLSLLIGHGYNSVSWLRIDLIRWGLFAKPDQLSRALSLIPMTAYILFIGWIATKGVLLYFRKR